MTEEEALELAWEYLREEYGDGPPTIVMQPEHTVEHNTAWAVRFDTQEHLDTGDITQAPLVRVVVVFKDKSSVRFAPSALSSEQFNAWLATGEWPPSPVGA